MYGCMVDTVCNMIRCGSKQMNIANICVRLCEVGSISRSVLALFLALLERRRTPQPVSIRLDVACFAFSLASKNGFV